MGALLAAIVPLGSDFVTRPNRDSEGGCGPCVGAGAVGGTVLAAAAKYGAGGREDDETWDAVGFVIVPDRPNEICPTLGDTAGKPAAIRLSKCAAP